MSKNIKKTKYVETTETLFEVKGGFDIDSNLGLVHASNGEIVGYKLPDGRTVRLVVALEIQDESVVPNPKAFEYVTSEPKMQKLGFENLDYSVLTFYPGGI